MAERDPMWWWRQNHRPLTFHAQSRKTRHRSSTGERLLVAVLYQGPFGRLANWLWGVGPGGKVNRLVADGSVRDRLAARCDVIDIRWREWYLTHNRRPARRWMR